MEDSEEEDRGAGQEGGGDGEEGGENSGILGDLDAGSMTASGSGGHRLNTLEGAPTRPLNMNIGRPGQDDEEDDDEEEDDDGQPPAPEG